MTLNQVIQQLKAIALSHPQIKTFVETDTDEFDVQYPVLFAQQLPGSIDTSARQTNHVFKLNFLDRVNVAEQTRANRLDVQSDMIAVAEDLKAMLESPAFYDDWDIATSNTMSMVDDFDAPFNNEDVLAGVSIELTISTRYLSDRCSIPGQTATAIRIMISDDKFLLLQ